MPLLSFIWLGGALGFVWIIKFWSWDGDGSYFWQIWKEAGSARFPPFAVYVGTIQSPLEIARRHLRGISYSSLLSLALSRCQVVSKHYQPSLACLSTTPSSPPMVPESLLSSLSAITVVRILRRPQSNIHLLHPPHHVTLFKRNPTSLIMHPPNQSSILPYRPIHRQDNDRRT